MYLVRWDNISLVEIDMQISLPSNTQQYTFGEGKCSILYFMITFSQSLVKVTLVTLTLITQCIFIPYLNIDWQILIYLHIILNIHKNILQKCVSSQNWCTSASVAFNCESLWTEASRCITNSLTLMLTIFISARILH